MKNAVDVLRAVAEKGVALRIHGGKLHHHDPDAILTGEEIDDLREREEELILAAVRAASRSAEEVPEGMAPLTFQQEFALERTGNAFYSVFAARLAGSLDVDTLFVCVQALFERHGALRTRIVVTEAGAWQSVSPGVPCDMRFVDLERSAADDWDSCFGRLVLDWLEAGENTFAVRLVKLSDHEHVLVVLWDHLFEDNTSGSLLFRDLWLSYRAAKRGEAAQLQPLPMQYSDYAIWQRQAYPSWAEQHDGYWRQRLAETLPLRLPPEGRSPPASAAKGLGMAYVVFSEQPSASLRDLAGRMGVAMSFLVVSLFVLIMSGWSDQKRFAMPMTFAGRTRRAHLDMVGYMPNFLPIRVDLENDVTFEQLCDGLSKEFLTGIAHLDIGKTSDGGRPELLRGVFVQWFPSNPLPMQAMASPPAEWDAEELGLSIEPYSGNWPMFGRGRDLDFPGWLNFWEADGCVVGMGCFRTDLFASERLARLPQDMQALASKVIDDPHVRISSLLRSIPDGV